MKVFLVVPGERASGDPISSMAGLDPAIQLFFVIPAEAGIQS